MYDILSDNPRLSVRLDKEEKAVLKAKAEELGVTLSKYIRIKLEIEESP